MEKIEKNAAASRMLEEYSISSDDYDNEDEFEEEGSAEDQVHSEN